MRLHDVHLSLYWASLWGLSMGAPTARGPPHTQVTIQTCFPGSSARSLFLLMYTPLPQSSSPSIKRDPFTLTNPPPTPPLQLL